MSIDFLIQNNGNPVVLFLSAKSFRMNIECDIKKTEIDKSKDVFMESLS